MNFAEMQVITVGSVVLSGDIFLNGVVVISSGTVTFNESTIHVGANQVAVNASCIQSNNATIIVDASSDLGITCAHVCTVCA